MNDTGDDDDDDVDYDYDDDGGDYDYDDDGDIDEVSMLLGEQKSLWEEMDEATSSEEKKMLAEQVTEIEDELTELYQVERNDDDDAVRSKLEAAKNLMSSSGSSPEFDDNDLPII